MPVCFDSVLLKARDVLKISAAMKIDSYQFGRIVIDGTAYDSDCLIMGGSVLQNWRRRQGHLLCAEDLKPVIDAAPQVVVVGCGAYAMMKVPQQTILLLQENGIRCEPLETAKAVQRFNQLMHEGANAAAALHLTC